MNRKARQIKAEMVNRQPRTVDEVYEQLNLVQEFIAAVDPESEFQEAILESLNALQQSIGSVDGGEGGTDLAQIADLLQRQLEGQAVTTNLPIGLVGRSINEIPNGQRGLAVFNIDGSQYATTITAKERIERLDPVTVVGENNEVEQTGDIGEVVNDSVPTLGGDFQFQYEGQTLQVPRVVRAGQTINVVNERFIRGTRETVDPVLGPGETKEFARVELASNEIFLLGRTNATAISTGQYDYFIDSESDPDPDLSGTVPYATPPDYFEVVDTGYRLVENFVSLTISETSGSNSYDAVQGSLIGFRLRV